MKDAGKCTAAIFADTSPEWQMTAQAAFQVDIPITTVYTTLGHEAMVHGLNETDCAVFFIGYAQYDVLRGPVLPNRPNLKHIVFIRKCWVPQEVVGGEKTSSPTADMTASVPAACSAKLAAMDVGIDPGKATRRVDSDAAGPAEDSLAFVVHISGTTGLPKAIMPTQKKERKKKKRLGLCGYRGARRHHGWATGCEHSLPAVGAHPCALRGGQHSDKRCQEGLWEPEGNDIRLTLHSQRQRGGV
ncbi:unnamed protein product [Prorocentrum cordatum]|uniref:AMP-dependent synthetase/ligase domain-containing protein n=1 Tax=Prorocentrum cordatum TaxID=2364126 RepID=A0ABN9VBX0_9DINO|nr:unnamed protein product [Polarella glacialis]